MKDIHPKSRRAKQVSKQMAGVKRRDIAHVLRKRKNNALVEKYTWFKERIPDKPFSHEEMALLVDEYLSRFDEAKELVEISEKDQVDKLKRKNKHRFAGKKDLFDTATRLERDMFNGGGLDAPDFISNRGLVALKEWDDSVDALPSVRTIPVMSSWIQEKEQTDMT